MLTSSRTWPSILQKTMAVVQMRFDGKYAYSTIANINQLQKLQNQISITSTEEVEYEEGVGGDTEIKKNLECECSDLQLKCGSYAMNSSRQKNGGYCHATTASSTPVKQVRLYDHNRKRSESIKVENWDYIYRENPFLNVPEHERHGVPRSPQNGFSCDRGFLSGRGAEKLDTIFRHYYPESGFGWMILIVAIIVAIITHGLQLSATLFLLPAIHRFHVDEVECLGE